MARTKASAIAAAEAQDAALRKPKGVAKPKSKPAAPLKQDAAKSKAKPAAAKEGKTSYVVVSLERWIPDGWHSNQGPGTRKNDSVGGVIDPNHLKL
jgi:hypothetical protein